MHENAYPALHYTTKCIGKPNTIFRTQLLFELQHEYLYEYSRNIEILCIFKSSELSFLVRMVFIVSRVVAEFRVVVRPPWAAKCRFRHNGYLNENLSFLNNF